MQRDQLARAVWWYLFFTKEPVVVEFKTEQEAKAFIAEFMAQKDKAKAWANQVKNKLDKE